MLTCFGDVRPTEAKKRTLPVSAKYLQHENGMTIEIVSGNLGQLAKANLMNSSEAVKRLQRTFAVILAGLAIELALSEK